MFKKILVNLFNGNEKLLVNLFSLFNNRLSLNKNTSNIKCYMGDTGLLVSKILSDNLYTSQQLYNSIMHNKLSLNKGMIYENMIAQMLSSIGTDLYYYECPKNNEHKRIEIDFLISIPSDGKYKVLPIEVKSSKNYTSYSFTEFKKKFTNKIGMGLIIHPKQLESKGDVLKIPPYMFPFFLSKNVK